MIQHFNKLFLDQKKSELNLQPCSIICYNSSCTLSSGFFWNWKYRREEKMSSDVAAAVASLSKTLTETLSENDPILKDGKVSWEAVRRRKSPDQFTEEEAIAVVEAFEAIEIEVQNFLESEEGIMGMKLLKSYGQSANIYTLGLGGHHNKIFEKITSQAKVSTSTLLGKAGH